MKALSGCLLLAAAALLAGGALPASALGQQQKPGVALAPLAALGEIGEAEQAFLFNRLQATLSRVYRLVPQDEYQRAEEAAFEALDLEQCTEENCIRKIQELLQVGRLIVLQVIRIGEILQLTLTLVREEDRIVRTETCQRCALPALEEKVAMLAAQIRAADLGGAAPPLPPPADAGQPKGPDGGEKSGDTGGSRRRTLTLQTEVMQLAWNGFLNIEGQVFWGDKLAVGYFVGAGYAVPIYSADGTPENYGASIVGIGYYHGGREGGLFLKAALLSIQGELTNVTAPMFVGGWNTISQYGFVLDFGATAIFGAWPIFLPTISVGVFF